MTDDANGRDNVEPVAETGAPSGEVLAAVVHLDRLLGEVFRRRV